MGDGVGADDGARSGVGELDSGQPVRRQDVGAGAGPSEARLAATGAAPPRRSPARATRVDSALGGTSPNRSGRYSVVDEAYLRRRRRAKDSSRNARKAGKARR